MVIGCADSRVSPEVIFNARPGELFVVRNVANLVPPYAPDGQAHGVSAALEFGVAALKVQHIVVLGHAQCGGVKAFAEDAEPLSPGDFIGKWMSLMAPAHGKGRAARRAFTVRLSDAARAGERRQQPGQPADLPAPAQADRDGTRRDPRRLFRRRTGLQARGPRPIAGISCAAAQARGASRKSARRRSRMDPRVKPAGDDGVSYAALRFAWISLRLIRHSAICTALSAAPLRRLSDTTHIARPFSTVASSRMRLI